MVLEATIIIVDNSEHSRNGDYIPSRFEAQSDAVNFIFSAKTQSNPESSVGLMSMGGAQPEVLTTLTTDLGRMIDGMHRTKIRGKSHFTTALNVGALALKHRQNKSQRQRIILFTCSPLDEPASPSNPDMIKLAKKLKKNNIAVDLVAFGALNPETTAKLEAFHDNIKGPEGSEDQSNLVVVPPGPNLLSDGLVSSPILAGDGVGGAGGMGGGMGGGGEGASGGAGGEGFEFGVDPNADPELALALRMSMEEDERRRQREEREREEREGKSNLESVPEGQESGEGSSSGAGGGGPSGEQTNGSKENDGDKKDDGGDASDDKMDTS